MPYKVLDDRAVDPVGGEFLILGAYSGINWTRVNDGYFKSEH
jgi:hypothetical protein